MWTIAFSSAAAVSAFLLFWMQPVIGKFLLPWFGGTPLVWTVCMMFFQAVLLAGYGYAHLISTRLSSRVAVAVHLVVLAIGLFAAHFLPPIQDAPGGEEWPVIPLLRLLAANVAAPFFALSATAPLIQYWFGRQFPGRSPYRLYAVSNAGSLSAVLLYPFVLEPNISLPAQESGFFYLYIGFVLSVGTAAIGTLQLAKRPFRAERADSTARNGEEGKPLLWVTLSALGVLLLLSTTEQISRNVAVSSVFWTLPLCLYLLSFVFCFSDRRPMSSLFRAVLGTVAVGGTTLQLFIGNTWPVWVQLPTYGAALFAGCVLCHGELYRVRPAPSRLTGYYLFISLGGAVGGVFAAVVAPLLFPDMWEFPLTWAAVAALHLSMALRESPGDFVWGKEKKRLVALWCIATLIAASGFFGDLLLNRRDAFYLVRSFFGRLAVSKTSDEICLYHGTIRHGCQWRDPDRQHLPTTYFGPESGVGVAVQALRIRNAAQGRREALRIGVVGLGIGTSAAWTRPGDRMRFFEIDKEVVKIANEFFSYLSSAEGTVDTVLGDARLSLQREAILEDAPRYDLLVIDAFSGDAIPLHLITKEAFALYRSRLAGDGLLAVHISNQYLELEPLVFGLSDDAGNTAMLIDTDNVMDELIYGSTWIVVAQDPATEAVVRATAHVEPRPEGPTLLFTDRSSNLWDLL